MVPAQQATPFPGESQIDQLFDQQIIERMGREVYDQVFVPAIQQAIARIFGVSVDGRVTAIAPGRQHPPERNLWASPDWRARN